MTKIIAHGALAPSLLAAAAFLAAPASAASIHDNGNFGGTWSRIGPSHAHGRWAYRGYDRGYVSRGYAYREYPSRGYYGPRPYASYGPSYYDYGYGPGFIGGPGVGFSIGIY